ncbi:MAG: inositol monophosphatase [Armatimonadetes bacterium]|nr:inositol monophosphatase [Armatimonadota bacterium]
MSQVAHEDRGDTMYAIDVDADRILVDFCKDWSEEIPFVLVSEGLNETGAQTFPEETDPEHARFRMIVDPIDGTRGLMYDKRSAWVLTGIAPNRGDSTTMADIALAIQTEIPTSKQNQCDMLWASRGSGAAGERRDLATGERQPLRLRPSQADTFAHGFASVSNFFPGGKALTSEIEEELFREVVGEPQPGKAIIYTDQYISCGGQLFELMVGHDRFVADLRSLVHASRGEDMSLCVRPYDLCTELIAREAGCVVLSPEGSELDAPLDTRTNMSWVGYSNRRLADKVQPVLERILKRNGVMG